MNDEFLFQYRRTPRPEFADALYQRISQQPQSRFIIPRLHKLSFRTIGAMVAFVLVVAACVYIVVEQRWNKVGDIWVDVQKAPGEMMTTNFFNDTTGTTQVKNLAEAKASLDFEFGFPTWAPEGFSISDQINISPLSDKTLFAYWESQFAEDRIEIFINYRWFWVPGVTINPMYESVSTSTIAPGSFEEVNVQGQPAVLVHGDWSWQNARMVGVDGEPVIEGLEWDDQNGVSLYWTSEDVAYLLRTYNSAITAEDLIKMAESAK